MTKISRKVRNIYDKTARHTLGHFRSAVLGDEAEEEGRRPMDQAYRPPGSRANAAEVMESGRGHGGWAEMNEESKGKSPDAIMEGGSAEKKGPAAFKEYDAAHEDGSDEEEIREDDPNNVSLDYSEADEKRETLRLVFRASARLRKAAGLPAKHPLKGLGFVYVDILLRFYRLNQADSYAADERELLALYNKTLTVNDYFDPPSVLDPSARLQAEVVKLLKYVIGKDV